MHICILQRGRSKQYGSNGGQLSWDYYYSMAFGGLFYRDISGELIATNSFKELVPNQNDRENIKRILSDEAAGNNNAKGKKCD